VLQKTEREKTRWQFCLCTRVRQPVLRHPEGYHYFVKSIRLLFAHFAV